MAQIHLDINISTDYSVKNTVKIGGNIVNEAYFTRNIIKISPSPQNNYIIVMLPCDATYALTWDQNYIGPEVYIVDTVEGVAPDSLLDLAYKLNMITKI